MTSNEKWILFSAVFIGWAACNAVDHLESGRHSMLALSLGSVALHGVILLVRIRWQREGRP